MADLCGPSNALRNFQKHTSVDRTLQQDRQAPPVRQLLDTFRANHVPDPQIEAEFNAFVNAPPPDPDLFLEPSLNHPLLHPSQAQSGAGPSNWATEFERLDLNQAHGPPLPSSQFRQLAPQQKSPSHLWRDEFANRSVSPGSGHAPLESKHYRNNVQYTNSFRSPTYHNPANLAAASSSATQNPAEEAEAFAKAFQEAEQAFGVQSHEPQSLEAADVADLTTEHPSSSVQQQEPGYRIGSDLIADQSQQTASSADPSAISNNNDDELARVAGNLLEKVKDDRSAKFRESNFLSLMRQLRDKEVKVEGEKIVDVADSQELHPGGEGYPQTEGESGGGSGLGGPTVFAGVQDGAPA